MSKESVEERNSFQTSRELKGVLTVFIIQIITCWFLYKYTEYETVEIVDTAIKPEIGIVRLFVGLVTHILLTEAMTGGIEMMKFAVNHPWKFVDFKLACLTGLLQVIAVVCTELATYYMLLFAADAMLDVLANYAIVLVIVDFGGYFYALNPNYANKVIVTHEKFKPLFKWETTTS